MDRRLAHTTDRVRFRVDATRCDGQGVCALVAPELFELDRYGLAYVPSGAEQLVADDTEVRARGLDADAMCPRNAIFEELVTPRPVREAAPAEDAGSRKPAVPRLLLPEDQVEDVDGWRQRGGWGHRDPDEILTLVDETGLVGQGGAAFPTSVKWRAVAGAEQPVVIANGSEREPGTLKDRHLLTHRPALVLDGLRQAMRAVGSTLGIIAVDEEAVAAIAAVRHAVAEASAAGHFDDVEIRLQDVPDRYVAGEETALIAVIEGGKPLPRIRPPFPTSIGVFGRPTLVQNVETLAQLALAATMGADEYRRAGLPDSPGTSLFTIGPFGGPFTVTERVFGYSLRDLIAEHDLLNGARGALVGGFAGGLVPASALDVPLSSAALRAAGASLGTKSVQVLTADHCPVRVATDIVTYFGEQTADQCPPCSRGLPDMAAILRGLEEGNATEATLTDLRRFMSTLSGRGVCRLPDGAARVVLTLFDHFAEDVAAHVAGGCP